MQSARGGGGAFDFRVWSTPVRSKAWRFGGHWCASGVLQTSTRYILPCMVYARGSTLVWFNFIKFSLIWFGSCWVNSSKKRGCKEVMHVPLSGGKIIPVRLKI